MRPLLKIAALLVVALLAWKGLRTYSDWKLMLALQQCFRSPEFAQAPRFRDEQEARAFTVRLFDCAEARLNPVAGRFFDKQAWLRTFRYTQP